MGFYTVIMEFGGETYISQVHATNEERALSVWAKTLDIDSIPGLGMVRKKALIPELRHAKGKNDVLVALDTLKNAWCTSTKIGGTLALINIIKTASRRTFDLFDSRP